MTFCFQSLVITSNLDNCAVDNGGVCLTCADGYFMDPETDDCVS